MTIWDVLLVIVSFPFMLVGAICHVIVNGIIAGWIAVGEWFEEERDERS